MNNDFNLVALREILINCEEYEPNHHLDRPFMSAYQVAIRFAAAYPNHPLVRTLPLGGEGSGESQSLAQRIARFLSQAIRAGEAGDTQGAFLSHDNIDDLRFEDQSGAEIRVSTLKSAKAHSIFRVPRPKGL